MNNRVLIGAVAAGVLSAAAAGVGVAAWHQRGGEVTVRAVETATREGAAAGVLEVNSTDQGRIPDTPTPPADPYYPTDFGRAAGAERFQAPSTPQRAGYQLWVDTYPVDVSVGALATFYRAAADANGWVVERRHDTPFAHAFTATKAQRRVTVTVAGNTSGDGTTFDSIIVSIEYATTTDMSPAPSYRPRAHRVCGTAADAPTSADQPTGEVTDQCTRDAIADAYTTAITGDRQHRPRSIRGGETLGEVFTATDRRFAALRDRFTVDIIGMMWNTPGTVTVRFRVLMGDTVVRVLTDGAAVLTDDGRWVMARGTYCKLTETATRGAVTCPPDSDFTRYDETIRAYAPPGFQASDTTPVAVLGG